jgi:hypothetical protein
MLGRPRATAGCPEGSSSAGARPTASQAPACWAARSWNLSRRSWLKASICFRVKSDRKSSPTGERPSRRCWAPPPGPPCLASRRHASRRHTSGMARRFGAPEAPRLPGADRKRKSKTRTGNENRKREPGTGTGAMPSESPLLALLVPCQPLATLLPLSLQPRANRWTKAKLSNVSFMPTA